jgi:hypothetical protein
MMRTIHTNGKLKLTAGETANGDGEHANGYGKLLWESANGYGNQKSINSI